MVKRIFAVLLALCCAFCFISQPVSAASTGAGLIGILGIGMIVAGAFGLTFANNSGYESFGSLLQSKVISSPAGAEWWNLATNGNIILSGLDATVKDAIWSCAKQAADSLPQTESGSFAADFTLSSYSLKPDGSVSSWYDFRGDSYSFSHAFNVPIFCLEFVSHDDRLFSDSLPYKAYVGAFFFSSEEFSLVSSSAGYSSCNSSFNKDYSYYYIPAVVSSSYIAPTTIDDYRLRQNCTVFSSIYDVHSYAESLCAMSSGVSSSGGATAAYPTYGYDGVNLPNIDLKQAGLIAEDGTSTVSDLIAQLQSGAITWEDYIGTVAPGQTATITLTDANGATATYTLTNTGVGEKIDTGSGSEEETKPVVVPPAGEETLTDAISLLQNISTTITNFMTKVETLLQSIYDWCVATWDSFLKFLTDVWTEVKAFFADVLTALQAVYDAVIEWCTKLVDAIVDYGTKVWEAVLSIPQAIADVLTSAFVVSDTFLQTKVDGLIAKYPYLNTFLGLGADLKSFTLSLGTKPPIIYIDLGTATGSYAWGGRIVFIDLTWYAQYKPTVDNLVGAFIWLWFAWRLYLSIPGIIQGMSATWSQPDSVPDAPFRAWPQTHNHLDSGNKRLPPGSRHKDKGE